MPDTRNPAAVALSKLGASKGGHAAGPPVPSASRRFLGHRQESRFRCPAGARSGERTFQKLRYRRRAIRF